MDDIAIARALHVVSVVVWIGGVIFMTTIVLPSIRRSECGDDWLKGPPFRRASLHLGGPQRRTDCRRHRFIHRGTARSLAAVRIRQVLVDACHARPLADLHGRALRCRASHPPSTLRRLGGGQPPRGIRIATEGSCSTGRPLFTDHPRFGCRCSRLDAILTSLSLR